MFISELVINTKILAISCHIFFTGVFIGETVHLKTRTLMTSLWTPCGHLLDTFSANITLHYILATSGFPRSDQVKLARRAAAIVCVGKVSLEFLPQNNLLIIPALFPMTSSFLKSQHSSGLWLLMDIVRPVKFILDCVGRVVHL